MYKKTLYLLLYFFTSVIIAQTESDTVLAGKVGIIKKDSVLASKIGWMAYPYAFYTPETQFAIGAGALVYFRTSPEIKLQQSKILFAGYYTTNDQYFMRLAPTLYFKGEKKFLNETQFLFAKEKMEFHGTGSIRDDIEDPDYTHRYFRFSTELIAKKIIADEMYTGLNIDLSTNSVYDFDNNIVLTDSVYTYGKEGGFVSGLGWTFFWDTRNYQFYPTQNGYYKLKVFFYNSLFFSEFNYTQVIADLRQYFELLPNQILAFQLYFDGTNGDTPFFRLPMMGGSQRMRGYFEGSYRDKRFITFQAEYRTRIWWRFGAVAFCGIGNVGENFFDMELKHSKFSYGGGLRFLFDKEEHINLRIDFGFGKNTSGVYFGMEEAF